IRIPRITGLPPRTAWSNVIRCSNSSIFSLALNHQEVATAICKHIVTQETTHSLLLSSGIPTFPPTTVYRPPSSITLQKPHPVIRTVRHTPSNPTYRMGLELSVRDAREPRRGALLNAVAALLLCGSRAASLPSVGWDKASVIVHNCARAPHHARQVAALRAAAAVGPLAAPVGSGESGWEQSGRRWFPAGLLPAKPGP